MDFKVCSHCHETLPVSDFYPRNGRCKKCFIARVIATRRLKFPPKQPSDSFVCSLCGIEKPLGERYRGKGRQCTPCCRERAREAVKVYYHSNREEVTRRRKEFFQKNPQRRKESNKRSKERRKEKLKMERRAYREKNKELIKERRKQYRKEKMHILLAIKAKRRAKKRAALPGWADLAKIAGIYKSAKEISDRSGEQYHVDHIVPLIHPLVCGLHCESNLQVLRSVENLKKSNSYWPDMP